MTDKRVSWVELFFDLVFVFAVMQLGDLLAADHSVLGVVRVAVLFVALWWAWVGTSIHADVRDVDSQRERLGILVAGLPMFLMALAVPGAYSSRGPVFALSYLALGAVLAVLFFRGRLLELNPYSLSLGVTGPLLVLGSLLDGTARLAVWGVAALVNLLSPVTTIRISGMRFDPAHLTERFGLIVIVATGESLIAIGLSTVDHPLGVVTVLGYALVAGLWWVYFAYAAPVLRDSLADRARQRSNVWMLNYGHLLLVAGLLFVALGLEEAIVHPATPLSWPLAAGTGLYLLSYGGMRWWVSRRLEPWALAGVGACGIVQVINPYLPVLASVAALVGILCALVAAERWGRSVGADRLRARL